MAENMRASDIKPGRLEAEDYLENFSDAYPLLNKREAFVESERCYFCYDAPCVQACPTSIDIPQFIRQIATDNPDGSAKTIFEQNILGGMCARVCPTEQLCEEMCVREVAEGKPVKIGELQRYATDHYMAHKDQPFERAAPTGKKVAVVGAGPAGLSCAHRLSSHGHDVVLFDANEKLGGLNEYGIAAYKSTEDFAQREVDFVIGIGGIKVEAGKALGRDVTLSQLRNDFDAVFLGAGLGSVNALGMDGEDADGVMDAVSYIADLRQADQLDTLPVGRKIVVIGGGMTATDIANQTKRLGADDVTIVYRRGQGRMNASSKEQKFAQTTGVTIRTYAAPKALVANGSVNAITFEHVEENEGKLSGTGEIFTLEADMVFKAIGQTLHGAQLGSDFGEIELEKGRIKVNADRKSSLPDVWAGGDCVSDGDDLTVVAVEDGKIAAENINQFLKG
ncbi:MAG: NAD(P)-dependent oxidoreductase [Hyphomicrobiales bacterium]